MRRDATGTVADVSDERATEYGDEELLSRYPDQPIDHGNRWRYVGWLEGTLLVNRCADCGRFHEPPSPICPTCWSAAVEPTEVSGRGAVHMAIFLHQGPPADGVDYATPYPVVVVELDEQPGLRYAGTVVDAANGDISIGRRVELAWLERAGSPRPAFRLEEV
jgi:uncharacterized OB-fold protein